MNKSRSIILPFLFFLISISVSGHVLQIIVTDNNAKKKYQTASRWIDFEIIE